MDIPHTRNFCIIAHIDHGKSTLADRLLERTGAISQRQQVEQVLDQMDLERERGITIKAKAVTIYHTRGGERYELNLIDTPGHVDFSYEVSRSLAACEGALLLVDAAQGIEAQTVANLYLALDAGLDIIPVINKIDLGAARVSEVKEEIVHVMGIDPNQILAVSAKEGIAIDDVFNAVIDRISPPKGDPNGHARALIFDAVYDEFRGVIVYVRVFDGSISRGDKIRMIRTGRRHEVLDVGSFRPQMTRVDSLITGQVGYLICNIKGLREVHIGDTVTHDDRAEVNPLPGYKEPLPMVYCGLYPVNHAEVTNLRAALDKLQLNDSSFTFSPESSEALGFGFRCGFLGLLHMEIVQERLERESNVDVVQTAPNVTYEVVTTDGKTLRIERPSDLPEPHIIAEFHEPYARVSLVSPAEHIGSLMALAEERHANYVSTEYLGPQRVVLTYRMPLAELIFDFYDKLKSVTHGYGTMDYEIEGFRPADLAKVDILVGSSSVDALSTITRREDAERKGRAIIKKLLKEIPRHLFEIPLQAAIGGKIIARENIKPLRKNVIAKCYGGDVTRKRKLLEKQKKGKKRMKRVGNVEIPQEAFLSILKAGREEQGKK